MRVVSTSVLTLAAVLAAGPVHAVDKEAINAAVERGVRNLRAHQNAAGEWAYDQIGMTALAGLTLLECGVPADDPAIEKAAAAVRAAGPETDQVYSISLSILFLDRLGEPVDVALIESLAVRLIAAQNLRGCWSYSCPKIGEAEQRRLTTLVKDRQARGPDKSAPRPEPGKRTPQDLPREIQDQIETLRRQRAAGAGGVDDGLLMGGDNSNTQFAVLGLWVARRHGLPVDGSLGATDNFYRRTQSRDGGWGYKHMGLAMPGAGIPLGSGGMGSSPAMTCAGLIGVGAAYAAWNDAAARAAKEGRPGDKPGVRPQDPSKDRVVLEAFNLLGRWIDLMAAADDNKKPQVNGINGKFYYFLWSLERVAVAYNVDKLGQTDWYDWGADILLANQGLDGGWNNGAHREGPDTCFALLFLKRANLVQDLSRSLTSQMKDGMQAALRSGGVSGADLVKGRRPFFGKPASEDREKPDADARAAKLGKQLPTADGDRQEQIVKELQEGKGAAYTEALAGAIPRLDGEARKKARQALADRLSHMTSETLGVKLSDDDAEVRRAAALAVAMKEDRAHTYRLIELLGDEEVVSRAAYAALKSLSNEDFGPTRDAKPKERARAILAWKAWWARQQEKK
jgi:hypothetical protein